MGPFGIGGGAGFRGPPCPPLDKDVGIGGDLEFGFDTNFRYGHPLGPFGMIALSMPELPGEKASEMARMCKPWSEDTPWEDYPDEPPFNLPSRHSNETNESGETAEEQIKNQCIDSEE